MKSHSRSLAHDLFGDGPFYLLHTPGHAIGHLAGLARTTADTFIMMGGDLCHHAGAIRPSPYSSLAKEIQLDAFKHLQGGFCPGSEFESLQQSRGRNVDELFFVPNFAEDIAQALNTLGKVQVPDANDNVLFIYAHDSSIKGVVDMFPAEANDWKAKGWREQGVLEVSGRFQGCGERVRC